MNRNWSFILLAQPKLVLRIAEAHAAAGGWQQFNGCLLASRTSSPYFVVVVVEERSKFPQRQQNSAGPCQLGSQRETRGQSAAVALQGTCGIGVRVGPRVNGPFWSTCKDTDAPSILRSAAVGDKSAEKLHLNPVRFGRLLQHRYYCHLGSCRRRNMEPSSRLQAENDLRWCSSPSAQAARWSAQWWVRTRPTTRLTRPFAAKTFQVPSRQLSPSKDGADQQPRS